MVGLGGAVSMEGSPLGNLILSANVFTADTALTKSIFFSRPENRVSGGGVGNTGNLDSYSVTLDGSAIPLLGGQVAWHLGVSSLTKGKEAHDQTGLVGELYGSHRLSQSVSFEWVGEIAQLQNEGGGELDVNYYTAGAVVTFAEKFNLAVAHTLRDGATKDTITQISAGMEIYDGWSVDVGYKMTKKANEESQTVGVLLAKTFEFNTGE